MTESFYAVFKAGRYHNSVDFVKATAKEPALKSGEVSVKVVVEFPDNFFKTPTFQVTVAIPEKTGDVTKAKIEAVLRGVGISGKMLQVDVIE